MSDKKVIYVIPLISAAVASDWKFVISNLNNTLKSLLRQTSNQLQIIIVSHDDLTGIVPDDEKITNLVVDFPIPEDPKKRGHDKSKKLRFAGVWMRQSGYDGDYVFFLDADDWVDKRTTAELLRLDSDAYLMAGGYKFDLKNKLIGRVYKAFFMICGSCFVSSIAASEFPRDMEDGNSYYSRISGSHASRASMAIVYDKKVTPIYTPFVAYVFNHEASLEVAAGKRKISSSSQQSIKPDKEFLDNFSQTI